MIVNNNIMIFFLWLFGIIKNVKYVCHIEKQILHLKILL